MSSQSIFLGFAASSHPLHNRKFRTSVSNWCVPKRKAVAGISRGSSYNVGNRSHHQGCIRCLQGSSTHIVEKHELEITEPKVSILNELERLKNLVKARLDSVGDGDINVSPYDTAWVALVENVHGESDTPQFPTSLQWIAENQLPDGSWGDKHYFSAYDRLLHTLACSIALTRWNVHPQASHKGLEYVRKNIGKLEEETFEHMPAGFEVLFPALMDLAQQLHMHVPHDSPIIENIYQLRTIKLNRIPRCVLHKIPTTMLFSLEGFPDKLEWDKLMRLQSADGSFLNSPSSTAFALMNTNDTKCRDFIERTIQIFNGGVPFVYPMDLFARNWAIDRLQRLGVSRYFKKEFKEFMSYVNRYWTDTGIGITRGFLVHDIDVTSMGWRLLRLYGYEMSPDVFQHFRQGDEFFTFPLQTTEAVTPIFQLYRASQIMFPGEKMLEDAKEYSYKFLLERRANNQIFDKWLICKDLPGEIEFALSMPWYAFLPRIETRFYLEQYGGESDCWIGKVFYRIGDISNNDYLEFAKLDYNHCQAVHQLEWKGIQKWYTDNNLEAFGISREYILSAYFIASSSIFEPERSKERLAWAKTSVLIEILANYLEKEESFDEQRKLFIRQLDCCTDGRVDSNGFVAPKQPVVTLLQTIKDLSAEASLEHSKYVHHHLCDAWKKWLMAWEKRSKRSREEGELIVRTISTCEGYFSEELMLHPQYKYLANLTNKISQQLPPFEKNDQVLDESITSKAITGKVDRDMQELVQLVLTNSPSDIDSGIKKTFLNVSKSFYYRHLFGPNTVKSHIEKVLFQSVV